MAVIQFMFLTQKQVVYRLKKKLWKELGEAALIGKELLQGKIDYKDGGNSFGLFLAVKINFCVTINKCGVIDEHRTLEGLTNEILNRKKYFKLFDGDKLVSEVPLSWKRVLVRV